MVRKDKVMPNIEVEVSKYLLPDLILSEQYKAIQIHIENLRKNHVMNSIFLTSTNSLVNKTTTILTMAAYFSKLSMKVLLVDGDLRKQSLTQVSNLEDAKGFSSLLRKESSSLLGEVYPTNIDNLFFMPSGKIVENPVELLLSESFHTVHVNMKECFDLVFFDTPPIDEVTDTLILAQELNGCILVNQEQNSKKSKDDVTRVKEVLNSVNTHFIGTINTDIQFLNSDKSQKKNPIFNILHL